MIELVVVRHGETLANKEHIIQGHLDTQLSEVGLAQAERVAALLAPERFHLALSSDLQRAKRTGEAIRDKNPSYSNIQLWEVLRERNFGDLEGKSVDHMLNAIRGLNKAELVTWGPPNGETGTQFRERVAKFLNELGRAAASLEAEEERVRVLVTSHGGFIREMNQLLVRRYACTMPCQGGEYGRICPNTGVSRYELTIEENGNLTSAICTQLHFRGHLAGMEETEPILYGV